ncbi:MAG TPA: hypothetical protein VN428_02350 [Bryobacteraceae bacterium]|nr:hypothetical protein [Bryobacteraceae bacterium]
MMWFLRLFSQFRALDSAATEAKAETRAWIARCESAEARVRELTDRMLDDRAKLADMMSIHAIGKRAFSKADPVPPDQMPHIGMVHGRQFARQATRQQTAEFFEKLSKEIGQKPAS